MSVVLILGSHVASSRVGGTLSSLTLALSPFEIEPIHVPTTLMGRHPGWGPPGGGSVPDALFDGMLEGIAANGVFAGIDGVLTNYFASAQQVQSAARAIDAIKSANPKAIIVVDPVIGDSPKGQYVGDEVAAGIIEHLVPRADFLTPNVWELGAMSGLPTQTLSQIRFAAQALGKPTVVTSVTGEGQTGGLFVDGAYAWMCQHEAVANVPKGTGDLVASFFIGHVLQFDPPSLAMAKAISGAACLIDLANIWGNADLPIVSGARSAWASELLALKQV